MKGTMLVDLYQHYLYVVGRVRDSFQLHVESDHKEIHTFYQGKIPIFKLLFGTFSEDQAKAIVVSFQIEVPTPAAIQWFVSISRVHPPLKVADVHFEDAAGEIFYGEDAQKLLSVKHDQQAIEKYLEVYDKQQLREFVEAKVTGRERDATKTYSPLERDKAIMEFDQMKKPVDDDEVH